MRGVLGAAVCLALLTPAVATAGTITVSGSGTWADNAPSSIFSAPNETWSFSFVVDDPLDNSQTTTVLSGSYKLNGAVVNATAQTLQFFDSGASGLFDINFNNSDIVNLYGAAVYDSSNNLVSGVYSAKIDYNGDNVPNGYGSGTVTIGAAVPEPASIVCAGAGFLTVVGASMMRRRRGRSQSSGQ